jgi:hypothetical protein
MLGKTIQKNEETQKLMTPKAKLVNKPIAGTFDNLTCGHLSKSGVPFDPCWRCNPEAMPTCEKCKHASFPRVHHLETSRNCPFYSQVPTAKQTVVPDTSSFIIDSGCNRPLTNNKDTLHLYSNFRESVQIADSNASGMIPYGRGRLLFQTNNGMATIQDVMYCPTATTNLLSVGTLDSGHGNSDGHASVFCDGSYYLLPKDDLRTFLDRNKGSSIITGSRHLNGLYYINLTCVQSSASNPSQMPQALQIIQTLMAEAALSQPLETSKQIIQTLMAEAALSQPLETS